MPALLAVVPILAEKTMYQSLSINLSNLLLSLSDALELASPALSQHQMRTAFIAWQVSKAADLPHDLTEQVFIAALFHDVGALAPEDKIDLHRIEIENVEPHCILGEAFLNQVPIFEPCAGIVRLHHTPWQELECKSDPSIVLPQVLYLADSVERLLNRERYVLHQDKHIISTVSSWKSTLLQPEIVDLFKSLAVREDFWLDLVSPRLYSLLLHKGPCRSSELDISRLLATSKMFRNLIDFRSPFTAAHSAGVASTASAMARLFGLAENEIELMKVAGNLHDLGKMAVPNAILDKPGKLTSEEFAIMRQHTYFTYMVLKTVGGIGQIAEWAAFHHERLTGNGYPFHLDAQKLNIGSRIMAVSDVFTALAEDRPYRKPMGRDRLLSILKTNFAKSLDMNLVDLLARNFDEICELNSNVQCETSEIYNQTFAA